MKRTKKIIICIILMLAIFIGVYKPFIEELSNVGHYALMIIVITLMLWIFEPFKIPKSISSIFMLSNLLILNIPSNIVFSGFAGTTIWVLIPALFYGYALIKTGLGKRISYFILKQKDLNYKKLLLLWSIIGIVLSILTPSITVRVIIVIPIVLNSLELCNIKENTKERSVILLTAWLMAVIPGVGWQSGSLAGPMLTGFFNDNIKLVDITFSIWAKASLLPILLISILTIIIGYIVLSPEIEINITKETFIKEYLLLGKITQEEIITLIVMIVSFIMFATSGFHGIEDASICLLGLFILFLMGILGKEEVNTAINWDLIIFVGASMSLGPIFIESGISSWLSNKILYLIEPITSNKFLFIFLTLLILFIWRFFDIAAFAPTMALITSILPDINLEYGVNPIIWIPLLCIAMNSFIFSYMNMFILTAEDLMNGKGWRNEDLICYGLIYILSSFIVMLVSIPYWKIIGIL